MRVAPLLSAIASSLMVSVARAQEGDTPELPPGLSALPVLIAQPEVDFPADALAEGVWADVLLQIEIDAEGRVTTAVPTEVIFFWVEADGTPIAESWLPNEDPYGFVEIAESAVLGFRFEPARNEAGEPVPVALVWRFGFAFEDQPVAAEGEPFPSDVGGLTGEVRERGTRNPLAGIDVVLANEATGDMFTAVTDAEGRFDVDEIPAGTWRLEIDVAGYEAAALEEVVVAGERAEVLYLIERETYGQYVAETRAEAVRREVSRQTLTVTEISRIPGLRGDAVKVVQALPGFARPPYSGGLIVIRGSSPEESRVYVEGIRIPLAFHFGGVSAVINSELLAEVEYLPGAFSVEYGRAIGGVINLESRRPRDDRYHAVADIDIFDTSVYVEGPIVEDFSFYAGGRRSYIDAVLPLVLSDSQLEQIVAAPVYWDYQARLQWDPSTEHSFNLFGFGSNDSVAILDDDPNSMAGVGQIDGAFGFHRIRAEHLATPSETVSNRALVAFGLEAVEVTQGEDLRFIVDTTQLLVRDTVEARPLESLVLRTGLDIEWALIDVSVRAPRPTKEGEESVGFDGAELVEVELEAAPLFEPAVFLESEWRVVPELTLVPGVRAEFYLSVEEAAVDGRMTARWQVSEPLLLKASAGTFHQAPTPDEVDSEFGNPELGLETAVHYVAGLEYAFTDFLGLDFQLFFKDMYDLVATSDGVVERDGERVAEIYANQGRGHVYGAEVLLRHQVANNFFGWVSYTLSRSERRDEPGDEWRLFKWDQTHILSLVASYDLGDGWTVGARFRLVSGMPDTLREGSVYDADTDNFIRITGDPLGFRVPPFHSLDLRIDKRFVLDNALIDIYVDVENVYNRSNPEDLDYSFDDRQYGYDIGLPIIPSLGIRGEL